ncbi:MAG: glycosyltransferase family 1 protein [Spartobacteria bacterium]|nr:glycosyltransferase family 1 protein [Spartobacteria bacterium]
MIHRIDVIDGISQYDVFHHWSALLVQAIQKQGMESRLVQVDQPTKQQSGRATVGFNLIRTWGPSTASTKHICWIVDPPSYHAQLFASSGVAPPIDQTNVMIGLTDLHWIQTAREVYRRVNTLFLPHATSVPIPTNQNTQRDLDVVFLGSLRSPDALRQQLFNQSGSFSPYIKELLDYYRYPAPQPLADVLIRLCDMLDLPPAKREILFSTLYRPLDQLLRNEHRIRFLTQCHHPIHIFGQGDWHHVALPEGSIIHPPVSFCASLNLLKRTKLLINHAPSHRCGSHERIFDAIQSGCAVLSTPSDYLQTILPPAPTLVFTDAPTSEQILQLLDAPRTNASQRLNNNIAQNHSMSARATTLIDTLRTM